MLSVLFRKFGAAVSADCVPVKTGIGISFLLLFVSSCGDLFAQQPQPAPQKPAAPQPADARKRSPASPVKPANPTAADTLSIEQARVADRFKRLEEVVGRLAEVSASSDPRHAKLLREAISQSREQDVNTRFESVVKLLQDERLSVAATNQVELQKELDALLGLLLKADRDKELASQRERVRKYLKELDRLIRLQRGVRARTEGGDDLRSLGEDQKRLATDTGKLNGDINKAEGDKKSSSDEPGKPDGEKPSPTGQQGKSNSEDGDQSNSKDGVPKKQDPAGGEKNPEDKRKPNSPEKQSKATEGKSPGESKSGTPQQSPKGSEQGK